MFKSKENTFIIIPKQIKNYMTQVGVGSIQ